MCYGRFIRVLKGTICKLLNQGNEPETEFIETTIAFKTACMTEEIANIQTVALLSNITMNLNFMNILAGLGGSLSAIFDVSKCLDKTILGHFKSLYEKKSLIEVI